MNVQADEPQADLLTLDTRCGRQAGKNDTDGFGLAAQPDQSQGRPSITVGSQPIARIAACPYLRSPEEPLFRSRGRYDRRRTELPRPFGQKNFMRDNAVPVDFFPSASSLSASRSLPSICSGVRRGLFTCSLL